MWTLTRAVQISEPWHRQGLYMGMHWAWWLFWIAAAAILLWAFWRLAADRREARERVRQTVAAEETLRGRFARGEIGEKELVDGMRALRTSRSLSLTPAHRSARRELGA